MKMKPTAQDVANRLRPLFEKAVLNHTGVSYILSNEEASVFSVNDLEKLKKETGYPASDLHIITSWTTQSST